MCFEASAYQYKLRDCAQLLLAAGSRPTLLSQNSLLWGWEGGGRFALFLLHPLLPYAIRDVKNRRYYYVFSFAVHNKQVTTALYVAKILEHFFLTYCGPCIVIYLRNKDKQDALFSLNLFL